MDSSMPAQQRRRRLTRTPVERSPACTELRRELLTLTAEVLERELPLTQLAADAVAMVVVDRILDRIDEAQHTEADQ